MKIPVDIQQRLYSIINFVRNNKHSSFYKDLPEVRTHSIEADFNTIKLLTKEELCTYPDSLLHYPEREARYLASEFNPDFLNNLFPLPQRIDTLWNNVSKEIERIKPRAAILTVPPFWQTGPFFYYTCRQCHTPMAVMSPRNLPLTCQVIKEVEAEMIVATPDAAQELYSYLSDAGMQKQIRLWHLIVPLGTYYEVPNLSGEVTIEFKVFPGVPVGYISSDSVAGNIKSFVPSPDYFFELDVDNTCIITSLVPDAFPLIRFKTNVKLNEITLSDEDGTIFMYEHTGL